MESSVEECVGTSPSLPPNYVSLVQLQEQWLLKQKEKKLAEEREENQKRRQQELEEEGTPIIESQSQRQERGEKEFRRKEQGRVRNGRRRVEGQQHKVYVPKRAIVGNSSEISGADKHSKPEEINVEAPADLLPDGDGGRVENKSSGKSKKEKWKKKVAKVNSSVIGARENPKPLGDLSCRNDGDKKFRDGFGTNGNGDREVEDKAIVCVAGVVPENKGMEVSVLGDKGFGKQGRGRKAGVSTVQPLPENGSEDDVPVAGNGVHPGVEQHCSDNVGRKRGKVGFSRRHRSTVDDPRKCLDSMVSKMEAGDKGFRAKDSGNRASVSTIDSSSKNGSKEESPMAGNGVHPRVLEGGSVDMAKVLPKVNVEEHFSGNVGRKRGKGGVRRRDWKTVDNPGKWGESMDSEMEVGNKVFRAKDCGNSNDRRLGNRASVSIMKPSSNNASKEESPMAGNGVVQGMLEAGSVGMAELLPKNNVEEHCSDNAWRKRGERRFGGRQKKRIQAQGDKEMAAGSLSTKIDRDLEVLSLNESSDGNVTMREERGNFRRRGWGRRRFEGPKYVTGPVWVKKGEIQTPV